MAAKDRFFQFGNPNGASSPGTALFTMGVCPVTMKKTEITTSRGTFNVRDRGNEGGLPVIMVHGWPENSLCWEGVTAFLDPSLRVIAPDLRGLGDSERTMQVGAYQKKELAKDIVELVDRLEVESFFLVGHDWGGIVAQEVAFLVPERIKKFVIMNIPVITNTAGLLEAGKKLAAMQFVPYWYQHFQQMPGLPEILIQGKEDAWVRFFFGEKGRDGRLPADSIADYVRCYKIPNTIATAASYYRSMRFDAEHWATLQGKKHHMPTMYVYGTEELTIVPENLNHLEDCFDSIKVEKLVAGHFIQEEKPKEVAGLLNDFLCSR